MRDTAAWQRSLNQQTLDSGAYFSGHRQRVTGLLGGRIQGLRLCLLGAGNCNDVDLSALVPRFKEIVLVDVDAQSVTQACERQPPELRRVLTQRAPLEFSGLERILGGAQDHSNSSDIAAALASSIDEAPFDIVCSTCVLSQLVDQVRERVGGDGERCLRAIVAVREVHFALMLRLLQSGGRGVFVSDMVSTDTAPELTSAQPAELPQVMARLVAAKNFFTGLNPFVIEGLLKQHPQLAPAVARSAFHAPWLWQLGAQRAYLTFAISFQRA